MNTDLKRALQIANIVNNCRHLQYANVGIVGLYCSDDILPTFISFKDAIDPSWRQSEFPYSYLALTDREIRIKELKRGFDVAIAYCGFEEELKDYDIMDEINGLSKVLERVKE